MGMGATSSLPLKYIYIYLFVFNLAFLLYLKSNFFSLPLTVYGLPLTVYSLPLTVYSPKYDNNYFIYFPLFVFCCQ